MEHVTADYPPVFITAGDIDPLEPQTLEMIDVLESYNIEVTSALFTDSNLDHDFVLNLGTPHVQETFDKIIMFLNQHQA